MKIRAMAAWLLLAVMGGLAVPGGALAQKADGRVAPPPGARYTAAARSQLVDELCQCAVAARITGAMALGSNDQETQRKAVARSREFLTAAKTYMSPQYVDARYKSMALPLLTPERLNDASANAYILERAHMCAYILQNTQERLRYLNDLAKGR
ncbi:hypothetical protein [Solidesulfovibrio magneticus]|uniref:Uncharacterized protein n=1 Tax=Solidesulfovibrio magneticus (strain ATCC 700980 / DSM 13731 / RS-1) TaxID=573370 RepID=C4XKJ2_SOLM1|nr:hypothetical protein [Solidesulfovibrio magneticus]BAH76932.1 hypothetical protein DMR_34410 [Solidesulfovibrio magneticus RS-1]